MFSSLKALALAALLACQAASAAGVQTYAGIGRDATAKEVAAWDIDVRPDFKGLPKGRGSVTEGQDVWEAKCAQCHGYFGESGEVFTPIIGGTTAKDIETGHVANLITPGFPQRTTFMKVATVSTLWDFINRAMPWNAPKSLSTDQVYAVLAFMLNTAGIVADDFVLDDQSIREVQKRMPNRNGMSTNHALWPGPEFKGARKTDTANTACMKNCTPEPKLASLLPAFARTAHGNLAEQNRLVGAQHGVDTTQPEAKSGQKPPVLNALPVKTADSGADPGVLNASKAQALLNAQGCLVCHGLDKKIVGPAYSDVSKKYAGQAEYLMAKIKSGGVGIWGQIPMPAQNLTDAQARAIAMWLAAGMPK